MLAPDLPLKLSAAGIRFTGYMIEKQLRVAQVFGEAALKAGPFARGMADKAATPAAPAKTEAPKSEAQAAKSPAKPRPAKRAKTAATKPAV